MSGLGSFISLVLAVAASWTPLAPYAWYLYAAAIAVSAIDAREDQRRAKNQARDAYNASLKDRLEMADIEADAARTMALGRVRAVEGIRRRWVSGNNNAKLTMVVSFAGHEVDGFEQFYFDDVLLTLDAQGYVTTAPYAVTYTNPQDANGTIQSGGTAVVNFPAGTFALGQAKSADVSVRTGWGVDAVYWAATVSVAGDTVTITAAPEAAGATYTLTVYPNALRKTARIRAYTGSSTQNVGAALATEYPGKITSTDKFAGMALAVVDIDYDPDIYVTGRPNVTAVFRGAKVYDPRKDSTQAGGSGAHRLATPSTWEFSENPALHAYHFLRADTGWAVPAAEIRTADVVAAANACDVATTFTLRKPDNSTTTTGSIPRHRCGIVIKSDAGRREAMDEIMKTMAGRWGWAGGTFRFRAATMAAPVFDLQPSWVAHRLSDTGEAGDEPVVKVTNGLSRDSRVTRITGKCINPSERWQALPFPAVQDASLIAIDHGITMPMEVNFEGVNEPAHAQHLGTIFIRQGQAALRMELKCNLSAWRCELLDVGTVTLPRLGMAAKTFEVTGWRWSPNEGVSLTLQEIDPSVFTPVAELVGRDPAPNSSLPAPWSVQAVAGLAVSSGTTALKDGSIITRTEVSWTAVTQGSVLAGGQVEVQYTLHDGPANWMSWVEHGGSTKAMIPGLLAGMSYLFRVRAVQGMPNVRGAWSAVVKHTVATAPSVTTVKDSGGTTILGPGVTLPLAYTDPAARNSNVTIGGLGYTGDLNATYGAQAGVSLKNANGQVVSNSRLLGNLVDATTWVLGSVGSQPGFPENSTSSGGANYIVATTQPDGSIGPVWRARSGSAVTGNPEGGWNGDVFAIDTSKTYRFSVWINRRAIGTISGQALFGCLANSVCDLNGQGGAVNGNPYFIETGRTSLPGDEWTLWVGYVYPAGYTGAQSGVGGIFRGSDGSRLLTSTDFRWNPAATQSNLRTYQYYTTAADNYQEFFGPAVYLMDGTEPSLDQLLAAAKARAAQTTANSAVSDLATKLNKAGGEITGRVTMTVADGIFAGVNLNNGVYMGNSGLVGKKNGNFTFSIGTDGTANFYGDLSANNGTLGSLSVVNGGDIRSSNYSAGASGWQIKGDGDAEFGVLSIRGNTVTGSASNVVISSTTMTPFVTVNAPSGTAPTVAYRLEINVSASLVNSGSTVATTTMELFDSTGNVTLATVSNSAQGAVGLTGTYYVDVPANTSRTVQLRALRTTGGSFTCIVSGTLKVSVRSATF